MTRRRNIPIRSCSGCGERSPQADMVRFVASDQGLRLDLNRRLSGRGAYLHRSDSCAAAFVARKPALRSLRRSVDKQTREALVQQLRQVVR